MVLNFLKKKSYGSYSVASWLVHYAVLTHSDNPVHWMKYSNKHDLTEKTGL